MKLEVNTQNLEIYISKLKSLAEQQNEISHYYDNMGQMSEETINLLASLNYIDEALNLLILKTVEILENSKDGYIDIDQNSKYILEYVEGL